MPRKGENIYKRKDGRWEGRYIKSRSPTGKAIYGYVYAKSYRQVKGKLLKASAQVKIPIFTEEKHEDVLFEEVAMEWFESTKPNIKESTSNKYWNLLQQYILPHIGKVPLSCISHNLIDSCCNALLLTGGIKGIGLSSKTVSDTLSVIRSILRYCLKTGKNIPCDAQAIQVKQHTKEMRVLSRTEQEKLCRYLLSDLNAGNIGILVCMFTGLRVGEICALRWEDISISDRTIHVHRTMQRIQDRTGALRKTKVVITEPKSACSIRTIPIPEELIDVILSYRTDGTGFFLSDNKHQFIEPRTMQNRFYQALKKSAIAPANYHSIRHTFATRCIELGFDNKSLSEILGHASVNITMNRYVHPSMELKKENMQRLSVLFAVR